MNFSLLSVSLLALFLCSGCKVFDPSLVEGGATGLGCGDDGSATPPPRPMVEEGEGAEVVFGLKEFRLDQSGDLWRTIGFDLDNICSNPPDPIVECVPKRFPAAQPQADGDRGTDNAFGASLYPLVKLALPDLEAVSRQSAEDGVGVVTLRVRGWNGTPDDNRVEVAVSQSVDGTVGTGDTPPGVSVVDFELRNTDDGELAPTPAWDGRDWFWLREESFFMGDTDRPRIVDDNAYVANGELVVRLPDRVAINFSGPENGVSIRLTDATIVANITEGAGFPVTIAGRWGVLDLLEVAASVGICEGSTEYDLYLRQLESIADIRSTPGTGGEGVECDALSFGITFNGYPIRIAGTSEGRPVPNACE